MDHHTLTMQRPVPGSGTARTTGALIATLTAAIAVLLALPGSRSDDVNDSGVQTVYPLMLLPSLVILLVAGLIAACRPAAASPAAASPATAGPATASVAAVVGAITGLQVTGIALVASRDWLNFAGAGGAGWERGILGSRLAVAMAALAAATVVAAVVMYRADPARRRKSAIHPGYVIAGIAVEIAVPLLLCRFTEQPGLTAAGQYSLWWSLPWGLGLIAAGILDTPAARRAALLTVTASVLLTLLCTALVPLYGYGLRLPD